MHWSLWVALAVLVLILVILSARREGYAPPRDENTQPPYTEDIGNTVTTSNNLPYVDSTSDVVQVDNQTDIYKDMGGMDFQIQAGNPILKKEILWKGMNSQFNCADTLPESCRRLPKKLGMKLTSMDEVTQKWKPSRER